MTDDINTSKGDTSNIDNGTNGRQHMPMMTTATIMMMRMSLRKSKIRSKKRKILLNLDTLVQKKKQS